MLLEPAAQQSANATDDQEQGPDDAPIPAKQKGEGDERQNEAAGDGTTPDFLNGRSPYNS
ncbi:MAG: hypothetical protein M5U34_41375 [Chloroflexi bacterium]|nr:hypothetical protein [Chloroflexota bacterium]